MNITIGADPEIFVRKEGLRVSAHGLIPGTKDNPYPVNRGSVQVDGMALEFNVNPTTNKDEFVSNTVELMQILEHMIPEDYTLDIKSSYGAFSSSVINAQPPEALELGCDPDFNAYTGEMNNVHIPYGKEHVRVAAGHIHIGWRSDDPIDNPLDEVHFADCRMVAKELDVGLGMPSLLLENAYDFKRRSMYGQAGSFRPKPYGIEYRTLSNFWLRKPEYMEAVFNRVKLIMDKIADKSRRLTHSAVVQSYINNAIYDDADYIRRQIENYLPEVGYDAL